MSVALLSTAGKVLTAFKLEAIYEAGGAYLWGRTEQGRVLMDASGKEYRKLLKIELKLRLALFLLHWYSKQKGDVMPTIKAKYLGNLRVESEHIASGNKIITDAPVDNHGKGEFFSPTDLCVTALASCAMTIIGLYAQTHNVDVTGTEIEVQKIMSANPRRIGKVEVTFHMPNLPYSAKEKAGIERAAHTCPVHLSLHPETEQIFTFLWKQ